MRKCNCPHCGAPLEFDDSRDFGFCQYCGSKVTLDDYRTTSRIIDEARIKEAETDQMLKMKALEAQ